MNNNFLIALSSACLLIVVLAACATTQAEQRAKVIQNTFQSAEATLNKCYQSFDDSLPVQKLKGKVWLSPGTPPLNYLLDKTVPNAEEKEEIIKVRNLRASCINEANQAIREIDPGFGNIDSLEQQALDSLYLALIEEKITFGDFNTQAQKISTLTRQAYFSLFDKIQQNLQETHAMELNQRLQAAALLQQSLYQQQQIYQQQQTYRQLQQPNYTNCRLIGNIVNCTTW